MKPLTTITLAFLASLCLALAAGSALAGKGGSKGKPGGGEPSTAPRIATFFRGDGTGVSFARADGSEVVQVTPGDNHWWSELAWSPDGRFLATTQYGLRVLELDADLDWRWLVENGATDGGTWGDRQGSAWSPLLDSDGVTPLPAEQQFVVAPRKTYFDYPYPSSTGETGGYHPADLYARHPSPTASDIALTSYDAIFHYDESQAWQYTEGTRAIWPTWLPARASAPAVTWVVYVEEDYEYMHAKWTVTSKTLQVIEVTSAADGQGNLVPETTAGPFPLNLTASDAVLEYVAFSADGGCIAWTTPAGDIRVADLEYASGHPQIDESSAVSVDSSAVAEAEFAVSHAASLSLDRTGQNLAFTGTKGGGAVFVMAVDGSSATQITPSAKGKYGRWHGLYTTWEP